MDYILLGFEQALYKLAKKDEAENKITSAIIGAELGNIGLATASGLAVHRLASKPNIKFNVEGMPEAVKHLAGQVGEQISKMHSPKAAVPIAIASGAIGTMLGGWLTPKLLKKKNNS